MRRVCPDEKNKRHVRENSLTGQGDAVHRQLTGFHRANIGRKDYLLVLDDVVSAGVASSAVASEYLGTVLKVGGEGSRGN